MSSYADRLAAFAPNSPPPPRRFVVPLTDEHIGDMFGIYASGCNADRFPGIAGSAAYFPRKQRFSPTGATPFSSASKYRPPNGAMSRSPRRASPRGSGACSKWRTNRL